MGLPALPGTLPRLAALAVLVTFTGPGASACQTLPPLPPPPAPVAGKPTLLAVFAHPDDETTVSAMLAHYAAAGHPVYLAALTSGGQGTRLHAGIPAGPELIRTRQAELTCATRQLGLPPPVLLGFGDGHLSDWAVQNRALSALRALMERLRPDVVITWGPDGGSGHPDHRAASNLVTQVVQSWPTSGPEGGGPGTGPRKLYYVAWPQSRIPPPFRYFGRFRSGVADRLVTTAIDTRAGAARARRALDCHQSQFTALERAVIARLLDKAFAGVTYLRQAFPTLAGPPTVTREADLW
jgi:LmbE family N-acetylglucosaminyl deacetylase